jgi:uncharacterized membrane protein
MGWKIQGYAHHSPFLLNGSRRLALCVLSMLFIYGLFDKAVMVLIESEVDSSSSFYAEVRKVLNTRGYECVQS